MPKIKAIVRTVSIDRGDKAFRKLVDQYGRGSSVKVGILGRDGQLKYPNSNFNLIDVATVNEFGSKRRTAAGKKWIPERSFIRSAVDDHRRKIAVVIMKAIKNVNTVEELDMALRVIGNYVVFLIKRRITNIKTPKNATSTIRAKGSSNPLIDSGRMRSAVNFEVDRK